MRKNLFVVILVSFIVNLAFFSGIFYFSARNDAAAQVVCVPSTTSGTVVGGGSETIAGGITSCNNSWLDATCTNVVNCPVGSNKFLSGSFTTALSTVNYYICVSF
ncbi:MAG: hypothetical protein AB1650_06365 [Candidatus Omnitrophota bacterium]